MALDEFGITFKGDISPKRTLALTLLAEDAGFDYAWFYDSHVLWKECYPMMSHIMSHTDSIKTGTLVTNPAIRDISVTASLFSTLNQVSDGRAEIGIGRGDSSLRVIGKEPVPYYEYEEKVEQIRQLHDGEEIQHPETDEDVELVWTEHELMVWVAAYGPKMLEVAGKIGDGLILQICDPFICDWLITQVREGAEKHGRDPDEIEVMSCGPVWISDDMEECRNYVRWFPAMVGNHVADLVEEYHEGELPQELTDYIEGREGYDYEEHARADADHLDFIPDEIVERFSVVGTPEDHIEKLKKLEDIGVDQFNIYLMCSEEESQVHDYGKHIMPEFIDGKEYADPGVE